MNRRYHVPIVLDARAAHDARHRAMPELPVRRVAASAERIDHRVLDSGVPPPGHGAKRVAGSALAGEERRHRRGEAVLHVHRMPQDFLGSRTGVPSQDDMRGVAERQ